jgi:hypothetical protein
MQIGDFSRSSQSFSYSLLLHGVLLLALIYGLPGFLHKSVGTNPSPVSIDIMVIAPPQEPVVSQPPASPKIETEVPKKIDTALPIKADTRFNTPPKEEKAAPSEAQKATAAPIPVTDTLLSPEAAALEEKRKKEKLKKQSLVFVGGHMAPVQANSPPAPQPAVQSGTNNTSLGRHDFSWR